jgi:hypothetical protein
MWQPLNPVLSQLNPFRALKPHFLVVIIIIIIIITSGHRIFLFQIIFSVSFLDGQYLFFFSVCNGSTVLKLSAMISSLGCLCLRFFIFF